MQEKIIILDFGSQYTQLIARRVRELNTYCEIVPYNKFPGETADIKGVILSGSPFSVNDENALKPDLSRIRGQWPVLGVCYGAQYLTYVSGGKVEACATREYGRAHLDWIDENDPLFKGVRLQSVVWMSHGDTITDVPGNFRLIASTQSVKYAGFRIEGEKTWGVQFHPEVFHSEDGKVLLQNFLADICQCKQDWSPASYIATTVASLKEKLGDDNVILALSGGVDSSVAACLLNRAIGKNLYCIFVDNGLLRKNEFEDVLESYKCLGLNVKGVDAKEYFYSQLAGVTDPERKRKIIGGGFIDIFEQEAKKIPNVKWLAQGTIYPDCIESLNITGMVIKSHHNVGITPGNSGLKGSSPSNGAGGGKGGSTITKNNALALGGQDGGAQADGSDAPSTSYGAGGGGGGGVINEGGTPGFGGKGANGYIYIEWGSTNGGGGSSGQVIEKKAVWVTPGTKIKITVGKGGESKEVLNELNNISGYFGQKGNNGGSTTIEIPNEETITALGGEGGYPGSSTHGLGGNSNISDLTDENPVIEGSTKGEPGTDDYGGNGGGIMEEICPLLYELKKASVGGCGGNNSSDISQCHTSTSTAQGSTAQGLGGGGGGGSVRDNVAYPGGKGSDGGVIIEWSN